MLPSTEQRITLSDAETSILSYVGYFPGMDEIETRYLLCELAQQAKLTQPHAWSDAIYFGTNAGMPIDRDLERVAEYIAANPTNHAVTINELTTLSNRLAAADLLLREVAVTAGRSIGRLPAAGQAKRLATMHLSESGYKVAMSARGSVKYLKARMLNIKNQCEDVLVEEQDHMRSFSLGHSVVSVASRSAVAIAHSESLRARLNLVDGLVEQMIELLK